MQLLDAEACLIMANPHAVDPDSEDASNIMRVISVKNSCADKPVIVQLIRFNNKVGNMLTGVETCLRGRLD